jgi:hypothetical protein
MIHKTAEILTNLLIGLITILVPIFAVLASVLAQTIAEGRRQLKQNIKAAFGDIEEIKKQTVASPEATIKELKKIIRRYSWRQRKARIRSFLLSTGAAVYYPGLCFVASLALLIAPLSATSTLSRTGLWLFGISCGLTVIGIVIMGGVLETLSTFASTYDSQAPFNTPSLEVTFSNGSAVAIWQAGSSQEFVIRLDNNGEYHAQTILISAMFPPDFVIPSSMAARLTVQDDLSDYPGYIGAFWDVGDLHAQLAILLASLHMTAPAQKGEYNIRVRTQSANSRCVNKDFKIIVT